MKAFFLTHLYNNGIRRDRRTVALVALLPTRPLRHPLHPSSLPTIHATRFLNKGPLAPPLPPLDPTRRPSLMQPRHGPLAAVDLLDL